MEGDGNNTVTTIGGLVVILVCITALAIGIVAFVKINEFVGDDDGLALLDRNLSGADQELPAYNRNTLLNLVDGATAGEELLALRRRRPTERRLADFLAEEREALGLDDRSLAAGASLLQRRQNSTDEALAAERADARRMRWTGLAFALSFAGVLALAGWSRVQRRSALIVESGEDPARAGQSTEAAR